VPPVTSMDLPLNIWGKWGILGALFFILAGTSKDFQLII